MRLVPEAFKVPEKLEHPEFVIRNLCASDVYLDYIAVMSSIDIIRKTRGGDWPTTDLSFEDDMIDLAWHQREFEYRTSFAYTVMSPDGSKCLGCLYLFQPGWRNDTSKNADVDVSFWVTQEDWLFRSLSSACVHAAFPSTPCESALSSRGSESTKRQ